MKLTKFIILFIFIIGSLSVVYGKETVQSQEPIKFKRLSKELPVYKFKDNEIGSFLNEFCDSCCNINEFLYTTLSYASPQFILQYTPTDNVNYDDYICIFTYWAGEKLFNLAQGIIKTTTGRNCILAEINDDFIQKLQLVKTEDREDIVMRDNKFPMMTVEIDIISLLRISASTGMDLITILANLQPVQDIDSIRLTWFKQLMNKHKD